MAKRRKTHLSAGAALVTGIGMMGIATAAPAQAAPVTGTLEYECVADDNSSDSWTATVDYTLPMQDQVEPGETISAGVIDVRFTPDADTQTELKKNEGTIDVTDASTSYTFGADGTERGVSLDDTSAAVPEDGDLRVVATGHSTAETAPNMDTEVDILAGDIDATVTATTEEGGESETTIACTPAAEKTIGTITVGEGSGGEPTEDDWFTEPSSLPLADNVFTVEGTATKAGTLSIEVLGEGTDDAGEAVPGEVLETHTWEVTEGSNTKDFDLNEGAGYVRIVSQDCVDANGDDETVEGSGCNVVYTASWVDGGDNGDGEPVDDGDGSGEDGSDDAAGDDASEPEVPEVVQTDGLQRTAEPQQDSTLAFALGGLLLAGGGAGTVLVARRRAAARR